MMFSGFRPGIDSGKTLRDEIGTYVAACPLPASFR
jgi:hypothetical protein